MTSTGICATGGRERGRFVLWARLQLSIQTGTEGFHRMMLRLHFLHLGVPVCGYSNKKRVSALFCVGGKGVHTEILRVVRYLVLDDVCCYDNVVVELMYSNRSSWLPEC